MVGTLIRLGVMRLLPGWVAIPMLLWDARRILRTAR